MPDKDLTFGQNIKQRHTILCRRVVIRPPNRATFDVTKNNTQNVTARRCQSLQTGSLLRYNRLGYRNKLGVFYTAANRLRGPQSLLQIGRQHQPWVKVNHSPPLGLTQPLTEMSTRNISWG